MEGKLIKIIRLNLLNGNAEKYFGFKIYSKLDIFQQP